MRIQIALRGAPEDSIAVLGHELQHAVEVAEAIDVNDNGGLARLYQRIGLRSGATSTTPPAPRKRAAIRRELQSSSS